MENKAIRLSEGSTITNKDTGTEFKITNRRGLVHFATSDEGTIVRANQNHLKKYYKV